MERTAPSLGTDGGHVRQQMLRRVMVIANHRSRERPGPILTEVAGLRAYARQQNYPTVQCVAEALEAAISRGGRHQEILAFLDALHDAIAIDQEVAPALGAREALLASVEIRLGG
jgi:hypothetical protein